MLGTGLTDAPKLLVSLGDLVLGAGLPTSPTEGLADAPKLLVILGDLRSNLRAGSETRAQRTSGLYGKFAVWPLTDPPAPKREEWTE